MRGALDRLAHILAAFARQRVRVVLQAPQGPGVGQALALNLGVELGYDPVELLERRPDADGIVARIQACEPISPASTAIAKASLRASID